MVFVVVLCYFSSNERWAFKIQAWRPFLESPETLRGHFGWHNSPCIFKTKASRGPNLGSYFYFYPLYNIWKDQLYRISSSEFYEWLFGPGKFSGLSRNGPLARVSRAIVSANHAWSNWPLDASLRALHLDYSCKKLHQGQPALRWIDKEAFITY